MTARIYARSQGGPWPSSVVVRGKGMREEATQAFIRSCGFTFDAGSHGWSGYMDREEFAAVLRSLQDLGHEVILQGDLIIDLAGAAPVPLCQDCAHRVHEGRSCYYVRCLCGAPRFDFSPEGKDWARFDGD